MFPAETIIRRDMDFLRVAVESTVPVLAGSLVGGAGEGKGVRPPGACNALGSGRWMDALSAPEPDDESLIDTASNYRHPESSAETEHRCEKRRCLGYSMVFSRSDE